MEQHEGYGPARELPEDVVAEVLGRLQAPRSLAVARSVCKSWRAVVDSRRLLRADLLPLSLAGVLVEFHFNMLDLPTATDLFFTRSSPAAATTTAAVSGDLTYAPGPGFHDVVGHCNGLLLLDGADCVVANPATRQWARLPKQPPPRCVDVHDVDSYERWPDYYESPYLAFDPAASPHYEVVLVPAVIGSLEDTAPEPEAEWPPALHETHVFSSATGRWEERSFVREGDRAGTMAYMRQDSDFFHDMHNAVYWRGALYVHGQMNFFYKMSLANGTYRVIQPPAGVVTPDAMIHQQLYLGKSKHGVSCAAVDGGFRLRVWTLDESAPDPAAASHDHHVDEWVLKHQIDLLRHMLPSPVQDDDNEFLTFLGFHPFQDIVFFNSSLRRGLAYDFNSSV
ncbi:hypothetical protein EJB05_30765, partial [Eragrostis curvula]